ncbi:mucin-2 isoform X2 [Conger conger]|nr:mucin-2 isoform X2 [Conger conger]XP_061078278.1 mucin-2 isoform X2 [Conger conger]
MAPVTKDTKLSRASEQQGLSAAAPGRGSAAKKNKKLAANQGVHGGRTPADLGEGGAKVRQNNKKSPPKGQGVSPGDGVKVNAHTDRGAAPVLPKPAGQRPGPIATATGGHTSDREITKRPLKLKLPESKLVPFSESPRGGAMARMQGAESALKRPPRARTLYVPGDHDQLPGPMGSVPSDSRGCTQTSVWEHTAEGPSCKSPTPTPKTSVWEHTAEGPPCKSPSPTPKTSVWEHTAEGPSCKSPTPTPKTSVWEHTAEGPPCKSPTPTPKTSVWEHTAEGPPCKSPTPERETSRLMTLTSTQGRETSRLSQLITSVGRETTKLPTLVTDGERETTWLSTLTSAQDRETASMPMLSSTEDRETARLAVGSRSLAGGHTPPSEPHPSPLRSADWGVGRGPARPLGLEAVTELAVAYQGIGLSMVTLRPRPHPERVQNEALPTRLPAPQSPGSLTDRVLMEVRLAELPDWLASRPLLSPRAAATAVQRGWRRYYRKYIDVRRGGVGGVAMLLAGYCVLSYMWSYPHLKRDRWRRYH